MIGDFTGVPLRPEDRWTGARLAQARVVVDHEWNLNLFAAQRRAEDAAAGMLGPGAVVPAGSGAFGVTFTTDASGEPDLMFGAGRIWVDGLEVIAAEPFRYTSQPGAFGLPNVKSALVYLEVYEEVIPPVEDPSIDDPALRGIDASARSRVGYRVRVTPVPPGDDWTQTWAALGVPGTSAVLRIYPSMERTADPCASGAPAALAPDGWLRVEVMTSSGVGAAGVAGGQQAGAQLAWSFDNGASAAAIGTVTTGGLVTPVPTPAVRFSIGDLVEVSPPGRRALAEDHGDLYAVRDVTSAGGRDTLTLRRDDMTMLEALAMPGTDVGGVVIRRWDGVAAVQSGETVATLRGVDVGVAFSVSEFGMLLAGDWWGCRIRSGATPPLEDRENVAPDGIRRHIAPLAFLRLDEGGVSDLRQVYYPLADPALTAPIDVSPATVTGRPGDNLQDALARMPATGGLAQPGRRCLQPAQAAARRRAEPACRVRKRPRHDPPLGQPGRCSPDGGMQRRRRARPPCRGRAPRGRGFDRGAARTGDLRRMHRRRGGSVRVPLTRRRPWGRGATVPARRTKRGRGHGLQPGVGRGLRPDARLRPERDRAGGDRGAGQRCALCRRLPRCRRRPGHCGDRGSLSGTGSGQRAGRCRGGDPRRGHRTGQQRREGCRQLGEPERAAGDPSRRPTATPSKSGGPRARRWSIPAQPSGPPRLPPGAPRRIRASRWVARSDRSWSCRTRR